MATERDKITEHNEVSSSLSLLLHKQKVMGDVTNICSRSFHNLVVKIYNEISPASKWGKSMLSLSFRN